MHNPHSGDFDSMRMLQQLVESGTGRHNLIVATLRQMIENSLDAGSTEIRITINRGESIRVADNGTGMLLRDISGVNRLFTRHKEPGKGYGKNNSGRLFGLALAQKVRYWFVSQDFPQLHSIPFGWEEAVKVIERTLKNPPEAVRKAPPWWKMKAGETGTVVELTDVDWSRLRNTGDLRTLLTRSLSPWAADCVFLDGERLPRRETVKEFMHAEQHPVLGDVRCLFLRLADKPGKFDGIFLGKNPICSVGDFLESLTDSSLKTLVPDWMEGTVLVGYLDIPAVNKFAHHDRNKLQDEFYKDEKLVMALLTFLNGLARKLETHFSLRETQAEATASSDVLSNLASMLRPGTPTGPGDDGTTIVVPVSTPNDNPIIISPASVEMVVGTDQTFTIRRGPSNGVWDENDIGGIMTLKHGRAANFRAGNTPGKYKLTYFSSDMQQRAVVDIVILASAPFQISKRMITVHANQQLSLYVLNCDSETVTWEVNTPDITLTPDQDSRGVNVYVKDHCVTAPLPGTQGRPGQGFYKLTAKGSNGTEMAEATIVVRPFKPDVIEIDKTLYVLKKGAKGRMVEVVTKVDKTSQLKIDPHDPLLVEARKKGGPGGEMTTLLAGMAAAHLAVASGESSNNDFERVLQDLLSRVPDLNTKKKS